MKVWVVMGNDFPETVFDTEKSADDFVAEKKADPANTNQFGGRRIYWRSYEFELRH